MVGSSGSGKSTLAKLALGLYTPTRGEIQYDGISMLTLNKQNLRKQMGIVPQDINLFNKSILENIRMNQENISLRDVQTAAKLAQIHEEIEAMPMGYHTLVSEMGLNLSGGQRQRIALARALINKPRVIVLDEATSSLDAVNEQRVAQYLSNIGATRIIIAHRLSTIIDADKIYVMREGRIVEEGKHEELFQRKGYYYQLYAAQLSHQKSMLTA
ncbi:ATP-binding cassette domain-containing protein [Listeria grayi]|uniref:ATP-binding cassette domain-containing protein n=1 Tax=Listeria grayi TaxID=1641 RepID=UPI001F29FFC8